MFSSGSNSQNGGWLLAGTASVLRRCFVLMLAAILGMSYTCEASVPTAKQLAAIPIGASVQVQTINGRTLRGELVARTETGFDLRQPSQPTVQNIKCVDVKSIKAARPTQEKKARVGTAVMFGAFLAAAGIAAAAAGTIW